MRNVDYTSLWIKLVLIWILVILIWMMAGGTDVFADFLGVGATVVGIAAAAFISYLLVRAYPDEVVEERMKKGQCVECGLALHNAPARCPACGAKI